MINLLCLYLVNICLIFFIFNMLYRLVMSGRILGSEWGRGRPPPLPPLPQPSPYGHSSRVRHDDDDHDDYIISDIDDDQYS